MDRVEFIKQHIFGKVLDLGCEDGTLHELIYGENIYGLDIRVKKHREKVQQGDAQNIPFKDDSFDSIIAGELIEHLPDPDKFLRECRRILRSNGIVIISTPNKKSWVNRILKSSFHHGHVSLFDLSGIKRTVSKYFEIEDFFCLPYDSVSSWGSKHKRLYWLRKLVHYFIPQSLQEDIIILGRSRK